MSDEADKFDAIGADLPVASTPGKKAILEDDAFALERQKEDNQHNLRRDSMRMGAVGRWFGSRENAIIYIVALLVILCVISVAVLAVVDTAIRPSAFEFFRVIGIALVGFFAGRSINIKDD